jgi:nicotinate-nucleotide adenylyltransferase
MKIGLFFGSFNPVHIGHMAIANYMVEFTDIDRLWFVVSPQNPFKRRSSLLADQLRLEMVRLAINDDPRFNPCDIEFRLPKPSYTIDTLTYLEEKHPTCEFVLIMGADGLPTFNKWKNYRLIEERYSRYVYPRPGFDIHNVDKYPNTLIVPAPIIEISSTFIREAIKDGHDISFFLPAEVSKFINDMNLFKK